MITFPPLLETLRQRVEERAQPRSRATRHLVTDSVTRGVALLDERLGREFWLERVNIAELDVASPRNCVACQVTGLRYTEAANVLGAPSAPYARAVWGDEYGFSLDLIEFTVERTYHMLTRAWVRRVEQLRAERLTEVTA